MENLNFYLKKSALLIFALLLPCMPLYAGKMLETVHFNIKYNPVNSGFSAALAVKLESDYEIISSFLEIDPLEKINISVVTENSNENTPLSIFSNELKIISECNFNKTAEALYRKVFLINLRKLMNDGKGTSVIEEPFIDAIIQYPKMEQSFIDIILRDLVHTSKLTEIDFNKIKSLDSNEQKDIYTVVINFIITTYGKNIMIQSLKDADYYNGFLESLSAITGDSREKILYSLKLYIDKEKQRGPVLQGKDVNIVCRSDDYSDIGVSISGNGQSAVLQERESRYRILMKRGEDEKVLVLKKSENGSFFSSLLFLNNNLIGTVENVKSGSVIHLYNTESDSIRKLNVPYLYISDINPVNTETVVFSATCGINSNIYTININTGELTILMDSGNNFSPVLLKDKLYYVSRLKDYRIIELNILSGDLKTIYTSPGRISRIKPGNENELLFSMNTGGFYNIYSIDPRSGNQRPVILNKNYNLLSLVSGRYIYYLSYYKSSYRLFMNEYSHDN